MRTCAACIAVLALAACGGHSSAKPQAQPTVTATEYYDPSGAVAATGTVLADASGRPVLPAVKSGIWTSYYDAGVAGATGKVRERAVYVDGVHDDDRNDYVRYNLDGSIRDRYVDGIGQQAPDGTVKRAGDPAGGIIPE